MQHEMFASATDWIVDIVEGVQLRRACPFCFKMPLKSCHFWRISRTAGLGGSQTNGTWAMP
eukprot:11217465-Lingulodinium_polyedra.AAC.1